MKKVETELSYQFEKNCGGGGGPKLLTSPDVIYQFEKNCGGGGGPILKNDVLPPYEFEQCCGGGGGPKNKEEKVQYIVDHTIDIKKRNVHIEASIKLPENYNENSWEWEIGVSKSQIKSLKCIDSNDHNKLDSNFVGEAVEINLKKGNRTCIDFTISCDMKIDDFFDVYYPGDKEIKFTYYDNFWFTEKADLFMVAFNFMPSINHISFNKLEPMPIDILYKKDNDMNKIAWIYKDYPRKRRLRLKIEGKFI